MRKNAKQRRREALLTWRWVQYSKITAVQLAASLSCENLSRDGLPYRFDKALTEFRRLGRDSRVAACKRFLHG